jgi:cell filamentation protein
VTQTNDPYLLPNGVLRNKLGLTDGHKLSVAEKRMSALRLADLARKPLHGHLNFDLMQAIHWSIFQDIYDWAGQPRTIDISKDDSRFCHWRFIPTYADEIFAKMQRTVRDTDDFVALATTAFSDVNALHPFREGNGRTTRALLDHLGRLHGYAFNWDKLERHEVVGCSIFSMSDNDEPLRAMLRKIVRPDRQRARRDRVPRAPCANYSTPQQKKRSTPMIELKAATLRFDGGASPGRAAAAAILSAGGRTIAHKGLFLGNATNNQAEHAGLNIGLHLAVNAGCTTLTVHGDSQLVLGHVFGSSNVNATHLAAVVEDSRRLAARIPTIHATHVPRERNAAADALCGAVRDGWYNEDGAGNALGFVAALRLPATLCDGEQRAAIKPAMARAIASAFAHRLPTSVTRAGTNPWVDGKLATIAYVVRLTLEPNAAGRRAEIETRLRDAIEAFLPEIGAQRLHLARISG